MKTYKYNQRHWYGILVTKYQHDLTFEISQLTPVFQKITTLMSFLLRIYVHSPKAFLQAITYSVAEELSAEEYRSSFYPPIRSLLQTNTKLAEEIISALDDIRSMFDMDNAFFEKNFVHVYPKTNQTRLEYRTLVKQIVFEHIKEIFIEIQKHLKEMKTTKADSEIVADKNREDIFTCRP